MYRFMVFIEKTWQVIKEVGPIILAIMAVSRLDDVAKELRKLNDFIESVMEIIR